MLPREQERVPLLKRLGPGLITGAADDDPSGIATYSQAGAQFGLNMLWTMPVALSPFADCRNPIRPSSNSGLAA